MEGEGLLQLYRFSVYTTDTTRYNTSYTHHPSRTQWSSQAWKTRPATGDETGSGLVIDFNESRTDDSRAPLRNHHLIIESRFWRGSILDRASVYLLSRIRFVLLCFFLFLRFRESWRVGLFFFRDDEDRSNNCDTC